MKLSGKLTAKFTGLLACVVTGILSAPLHAETLTQNDLPGANGGSITLAAGTFTVSTPLKIYSNSTILGAANFGTHIVFNLAGGDTAEYGLVIEPNGSNVTIGASGAGIDFSSNHGVLMGASGSYSKITFTQNNIQSGAGAFSDGTSVFGLYFPAPADSSNITYNYFHDSTSFRNWYFYGATNSHFDNNLFYNIIDGGNLNGPGANDTFSNNYGTHIERMGQEIPGLPSTTNLTISGNVFYDWVLPFYNSFGISVVAWGSNINVSGNYFSANVAADSSYGQADSTGTHRFGYAIETCDGATVSNNTIVGSWMSGVAAGAPDTKVIDNDKYGPAGWGDYVGEPGVDGGYGSVVVTGGLVDRNLADAPAPPVNTFAGPGATGSGPVATVQSTNGGTATIQSVSTDPLPITGATVSVQSGTAVTISWNSPNPDITSTTINVISTIGRQNFAPVTVTGSATQASITGLHAGWYIDFQIVATGSNNQIYKSNTITAFMPGNAYASWSGLLWGGISVLKTDPYN